ncbi:ABC transporter substrate-binding protein [Sporolactobacillus pectinivorans]|uniref:ABC transporter substrate-binding protein n=1 Tax=Sporolactobacillus pectinivorans TaxID=1591408 RepID=UPI000C25EA06|nr:ABC transporter substrate-binding protein [Sporolactobacillus pectinivorans]
MKMKRCVSIILVGIMIASILSACGSSNSTSGSSNQSLSSITSAAKKEGAVTSVGMPDSWADWADTWKGITSEYGIKHTDTDMSSAEELAKFQAGKSSGSADIGDVGMNFAVLAKQKGLTVPYKTSYWNSIPSWAKDNDGYYAVSYTGSIAFMTDTKNVKNPPKTWADLLKGNYKISIGDVTKAAMSQMTVLAAAEANGGSPSNIQPGIDFFKKIAQQGRLSMTDATIPNLEKGEIDVAIIWDFLGLGYRDQIDKNRFTVSIPTDKSLMFGYSTVINKNAAHPNAAKLAREYILSDKGQINLAKGYARPIRSDVKIPESIKAKLLPDSEYKNVVPLKDMSVWDKTAQTLPQLWQQQVLANVKQ